MNKGKRKETLAHTIVRLNLSSRFEQLKIIGRISILRFRKMPEYGFLVDENKGITETRPSIGFSDKHVCHCCRQVIRYARTFHAFCASCTTYTKDRSQSGEGEEAYFKRREVNIKKFLRILEGTCKENGITHLFCYNANEFWKQAYPESILIVTEIKNRKWKEMVKQYYGSVIIENEAREGLFFAG